MISSPKQLTNSIYIWELIQDPLNLEMCFSHVYECLVWLFWLIFVQSLSLERSSHMALLKGMFSLQLSKFSDSLLPQSRQTLYNIKPIAVKFTNTTTANETVSWQIWLTIKMWRHCNVIAGIIACFAATNAVPTTAS